MEGSHPHSSLARAWVATQDLTPGRTIRSRAAALEAAPAVYAFHAVDSVSALPPSRDRRRESNRGHPEGRSACSGGYGRTGLESPAVFRSVLLSIAERHIIHACSQGTPVCEVETKP